MSPPQERPSRTQRRSIGASSSQWAPPAAPARRAPHQNWAANLPPAAAPIRLLESIPVFDDTSDTHDQSLDWPNARYKAQATPAGGDLSWKVRHSLEGAPGVEKLLAAGTAKWCTEALCAETLHTTTRTSSTPETLVSLSQRDIGAGTVHLWPGVVTVTECHLDPAGTRWGNTPILVGPGRWLVRGAPLPVEHQGSDPMLFIPDPNIEPPTAVSIKVEEYAQDTRFVVRARPDRIGRLSHDHPALLATWATALALLPAHEVFNIEENENGQQQVPGSTIGDLILRRLQSDRPEIALWDNPAGWDPMLAASTFVDLPPPPNDQNE